MSLSTWKRIKGEAFFQLFFSNQQVLSLSLFSQTKSLSLSIYLLKMFSFNKLLVFAAPLISLVAANLPPAPVHSSQLSQPYIKGTSKDAGSSSNSSISANAVSDCDHCYTCFTFFTPSGSRFLAFVGNMVVPNNDPVNSAATNYVWPGLQNNQNDQGGLFVLQPVLNGFPADNGQWSTFQNYLVS